MVLFRAVLIFLVLILAVPSLSVSAQTDALSQWTPSFDPSGAQHKYLLSSIGHPAIEGVSVGYRIRDRVWQESGGRLYVDFRPMAQLGGEKDVLRKLKMGAIHGMLCSSVAAANVAPQLGVVNLPFVVDTFDKLERFRQDEELFREFGRGAAQQGIKVLDFTGYGGYGWASTRPVETLEQARGLNFRIAQAPVNIDIYKAWDMKFTVMPWPDVPQALQTGVIDGLDHTPIVCNISKKFDAAPNFTRLDYAQGLYIHLANSRWLSRLPEELREILQRVITEESALARQRTRQQQDREIARAREAGVRFIDLPQQELARLRVLAEPVYKKWGQEIGPEFLEKVRRRLSAQ